MPKPVAGAIVIVFLAAVLALMWLSWRARRRRSAVLGTPAEPPAALGAVVAVFDGMHIATTLFGRPLERVTVAKLAYRAKAAITVAASGVVLELAGEGDAYIPVDAIQHVDRATWTIDRAVEPEGLVVITWTLTPPDADADGTSLDTYVRVEDSAALVAALEPLISQGSEAP